MEEASERVFWPIDAACGQRHSDVASMVCTMRQHMEQHLLASHRTALSIGKHEGDLLGQFISAHLAYILLIPVIARRNRIAKLVQPWSIERVRALEPAGRPTHLGRKNATAIGQKRTFAQAGLRLEVSCYTLARENTDAAP